MREITTIKFDPQIQVRLIPHHEDFDKDKRAATWYTRKSIVEMRREKRKLIHQLESRMKEMMKGSEDQATRDEAFYSLLGVQSREGKVKKLRQSADVKFAVLHLQKLLKNRSRCTMDKERWQEELISVLQAYQKVTGASAQFAKDKAEVLQRHLLEQEGESDNDSLSIYCDQGSLSSGYFSKDPLSKGMKRASPTRFFSETNYVAVDGPTFPQGASRK